MSISCIRCFRSFIPTPLSPAAIFCQDCLSDTPPPPTTVSRFLSAIEFLESNRNFSYNPHPSPTAASFMTTLKKDKLFVSRTVLKQMIAAPSCAICSDEFELKESVNQLSCRHWFHYECIRKWLRLKNNCPLCRHEFPREPDNHVLRSPVSDHSVPTTVMTPENSTVTVVQALLLPRRVRRTARIQAGAMLPNRRLAER